MCTSSHTESSSPIIYGHVLASYSEFACDGTVAEREKLNNSLARYSEVAVTVANFPEGSNLLPRQMTELRTTVADMHVLFWNKHHIPPLQEMAKRAKVRITVKAVKLVRLNGRMCNSQNNSKSSQAGQA